MRVDSQRIPELDGLRGTAIGLVILFHLGLTLPGIPNSLFRVMLFGWSGVDLFFVLSGFLIGGILIDHRDADHYFKPFYARRFFRIIPIYAVVLGGYALCWLMGGDVRRTLVGNVGPPMPWYAYLSFTNNLWLAMHNTMDVFLPVTWSLAVEEQFYLTLPLIVRYVSPKNLPKVIFSVTGLVIIFRIVGCLSGHVHQNQAYVLPWFRADSLMIGVICAMIIRDERIKSFLERRIWLLYLSLATLGGALFVIGGALPGKTESPATPMMTFGLTLVAMWYASLLLLSLLRPGHPSSWVLRLAPLRFLGKVSYCVYLIHQAILGVAMSTLGDLRPGSDTLWQWGAALVGIAVILGVAQLSWTYFESRLVPIGHRFKYSGRRETPAEVVPIVPETAPTEEPLAS
jgi:peptidoglycan/LPS O-acetylase OafA/YrhL